jgi:hypothetical protein
MKTINGLPIFIALAVLAFAGCKKDPLNNLSNEETRIYTVNYDTTANFSNYKTFSIADSAAVISNNQLIGRDFTGYDSTVIAATTRAMQQRGFTLVSKTSSPDLAVDISRVYNTSTGLFSYGDYWDNYGGYWDGYWGYPDYGYYSPYAVGVYSIQNGGLEIDLLDLKNAAAEGNKIQVKWTGLARGEETFSTANVSSEVAALFGQSANLKTN